MRQRKFYFLIFILCAIFNSTTAMGESSTKDQPIFIEIRKDPSNLPRTPHPNCEINAIYQNGILHLQFSYDIGEVEISVFNETTGEVWQQTDNSAFGAATIATSTDVGNYYITIVTDNGSCYSGNFTL